MANQKRQPVYEDQSEFGGAPLKILLAVACFGLAVLLVYLAFAQPQEATAMAAIRDVMRGIGGSINPLLALMLVWVGMLLVFSARGRRVRALNVVVNALLFLCAFTAVQLFSAQMILEQHMSGFANFVTQSYRYGAGGGLLGALLAYPLYTYAGGKWGGLIVVLFVALLCLLITGRAQRAYRWAARRADEDRHRREQRRNERNVEQMFEYDAYDQRRQTPQMRRQPAPPRPQRAPRRDADMDYMVIDSPQPAPRRPKRPPAEDAARADEGEFSAPPRKRAAKSDMEIPKSLRKIRESRAAEAKSAKKPAESFSEPPVAEDAPASDVPDFFAGLGET